MKVARITRRFCRKNSRISGKLESIGSDFYYCTFRHKHHFLSFVIRCSKLLREHILEPELVESEFHFAVWIFVPVLALFCTWNFQLITGVCEHHFKIVLKNKNTFCIIQQIAVNFLLFSNWLLNCCTFAHYTFSQLGNLKNFFYVRLQKNEFFRKPCNQLKWNYFWISVTAMLRLDQGDRTLIQLCSGVWMEIFYVNFLKMQVL